MSGTLTSERQRKRLHKMEAIKMKRKIIDKVKTSNVAFNLNLLVDGWLELESDPGTFSLLVEDFGCLGAQVEEIYDLDQKFETPVLGFIFLFKWLNNYPQTPNDRSRGTQKLNSFSSSSNNIQSNTENNKNETTTSAKALSATSNEQQPKSQPGSLVQDDKITSEIFFAKQMISNSCATHALISILLNCDHRELTLGPTLTRLKESTRLMNPENKGYAISNLPEIAKAHNSHASFSSLYNRKNSNHNSSVSYAISGNQRTNQQLLNKHEAYHFVSYVPINNRLYELDGLKECPIDHGPFDPKKEDWTEKFRSVIKERLLVNNKTNDDSAVSNEIRYNLMAVVPDKRIRLKIQIKKLEQNRRIVEETIERLSKRMSLQKTHDADIPNPPYSPISNATKTASETGSRCRSPHNMDDGSFIEDNRSKVDKFFCIKFDKQTDATNDPSLQGENSLPAHKNCIINVESTEAEPMNLIKINEKSTINNQETNDCKSTKIPNNNTEDTNNCANHNSSLNNCIAKKEDDTSISTPMIIDDKTADQEVSGISKGIAPSNGDAKPEEELKESKVNEILAHNDEKLYNLSTKPPFDFNILDDMQHVHIGKSTLKDLKVLIYVIECEIARIESLLKEEIDKRRKYKIDNSRRTHNYEPFIMTFLSYLAKKGNLADLIEKDLGLVSEEQNQTTTTHSNAAYQNESVSYKNQKPPPRAASNVKVANNTRLSNGVGGASTKDIKMKDETSLKRRRRYVSTGRPVGRPRKNPLSS